MKFLIILLTVFLFGEDKYEIYTKKLLHYHFDLKYHIKPPFEAKKMKKKEIKKVIEYVKIRLLSIFDNEALVVVNYYKGDTLVLSKKQNVKKGDIIKNCKVISIHLDKIILKCDSKIEVKTLNVPLNIKEER